VIILDTDVFSALMRGEDTVADWLDRQSRNVAWTTAVTCFEVRFGLESLPLGRRRHRLEQSFEALLSELQGRVLPLDATAADAGGRLSAQRRKSGRSVDIRDTQIAGIALSQRAAIATRNKRHFDDLDVPVIDPWGD
jgi:predicted nucleic acid-binding protein